jgi:two-component system response regulator PilR (NtrC family)
MALILVVDDEPGIREMVKAALRYDGHSVVVAASGNEALGLLKKDSFDLLVTDLSMPGMSGVDLLREASVEAPDLPAIVVTAYGSKESAIEAMRHGAVNYLEKPFDVEELRMHVGRAINSRTLSDENRRLRARLTAQSELVGRSSAMEDVRALAERIAAADSTVLITGESGTGKEVVARVIHKASHRAEKPFVGVNCAALPAGLLESEMFGHEKGSFTGAEKARRGLVEAAEGGTLFLDEIGDMPAEMQSKLLRVLQERHIRRVGGTQEIPVDVRVLAATHQDLEALVREGRFREDLYYRIHVIEVRMPPLRERLEDIPEFVRRFAERHARQMGRALPRIDGAFLEGLARYEWPGNIRELENVVERAVALAGDEGLTVETLAPEISGKGGGPLGARVSIPESFDIEEHLEYERKRFMEGALDEAGGVQTRAAERLGMSFRSFRYFAKKYGITEKAVEPGKAGALPGEERGEH